MIGLHGNGSYALSRRGSKFEKSYLMAIDISQK